ncbi:MAG: DNA methylase [Clostridia bacterium]|nr:DNA methylase [Clostridia bacterium]
MQDNSQKVYVAIDLKSFYASVECKERGLDPLTTNLVVADASRTEKTICLAVTPALKSYGIAGRARLFEVIQKVREVNAERKYKAPKKVLVGKSINSKELNTNPSLELDFIAAPPRMGLYMQYSKNIYDIYLKYFAPEDIFSYSIDEVFCDVTNYLTTYKMKARELVTKVIQDVYEKTGITATAGIGTNMYLCKVAMDIVAKKVQPNEQGVRIAGLDEKTYRKLLWNHRPLTDFWRVGKGIGTKLEKYGMYTMGDVAQKSLYDEEFLYKLFGVNAELLIDHAWGWEPCTIESVKAYKPISNSMSSGQVLHCPYGYEKTKLIVKEMTELLTLDLVRKGLVTNQIVLEIGYDIENLKDSFIYNSYKGEITEDRYGRKIPKHSHGTKNIDHYTASTKVITEAVSELYEEIINKHLLVRRINITANKLMKETDVKNDKFTQLNFFINQKEIDKGREKEKTEKRVQKAMLEIKDKYGKNAIIKGMNLEEGGTTIERNKQIGGHKE